MANHGKSHMIFGWDIYETKRKIIVGLLLNMFMYKSVWRKQLIYGEHRMC